MSQIWYVLIGLVIVLVAVVIIIGSIAIKRINEIQEKYLKIKTTCDITAKDLATILIANAKLPIRIVTVNSNNSNVYSSRYKVLKLSPETEKSMAIIDLAKITQEVGYAILDNNKNFLYRLKTKLSTIMNVMLISFIPLFLLGLAFAFSFHLETVGIVLTIISVICIVVPLLFYFITKRTVIKASEAVTPILNKQKYFFDEELFAIKDLLFSNEFYHYYNIALYLFFLVYSFTKI